jgi:hypothetical protein
VIVFVTGPAPVHSSVAPVKGGVLPPKPNADDLVPAPPKFLLAVFKGLEVAQEFPSYSSVAPVMAVPKPPKASAAV